MSSSVTLAARTRCLRLVAWGNAVLLAAVSPDAAADRVARDDHPHRVVWGPGAPPETLTVALARLAGRGATGLRLLLPAAGDPVGLPGPGPFATTALAIGAGVLVEGAGGPTGLLPEEHPGLVRWQGGPVPGTPAADWAPSLAEADRDLAVAVREATDVLDRLDVGRLDPEQVPVLTAVRDGRLDAEGLPPGYPPRAHQVLARAHRLAVLVDLARTSDAAAVTAREAAARRAALAPLERAARRAQAAACNAVLEPPR